MPNEVTLADTGKFFRWLIGITIAFTAACTSIVWTSANNTKNIETLLETVSNMATDNVRRDELIQKNQEITDLKLEQLAAWMGR